MIEKVAAFLAHSQGGNNEKEAGVAKSRKVLGSSMFVYGLGGRHSNQMLDRICLAFTKIEMRDSRPRQHHAPAFSRQPDK
jgi:hypothetical protein